MNEFTREGNWIWRGNDIYFKHGDGQLELRFRKAGSHIPGADWGLFSARAYKAGDTLGYYCGLGAKADAPTDTLWRKGEEGAVERRVRVVESAAGRYVVELAGWYVVCDDTRRNPAGLPNDAGTEHANVKCLGSGKMEAARDIAIGEELYWCYGEKYWKYWSTRPARNKLTKEAAEAAAWAVAGTTTAGAESGAAAGWQGGTGRPPGGGEGGSG